MDAPKSTTSWLNRRRCGYVYEPECLKHKNEWDCLHLEKPERMECIQQRLKEITPSPLDFCIPVKGRQATPEEIQLVHSPQLIDRVHSVCSGEAASNFSGYKDFSYEFEAVYVNQHSERCALLAAGSTIELVDAVYRGTLDNGFAAIRPPGHHASHAESNGFCIYNNVAIAARHLVQNRGAKRILIVDWDVHHGQGTQRIFYDDNRVLYFSIHKYHDGREWPYLRESNFDHIGSGKGVGFNINIPLNEDGMGDAEYMAIFQQVLLPAALEFNPEIIIVSAGYDAAVGCPEGLMRVTPAAYGHMTHALSCLAGGKLAVILEGGYFLESLAEAAVCTIESLLGIPPCPLPPLAAPHPLVVTSILNAISVLREHWRCLAFQEVADTKTRPKKQHTHTFPVHTPRIVFNPPDEIPVNNTPFGSAPMRPAAEVVDLRYQMRELRVMYDAFRAALPLISRSCYVYDEIMLNHIPDTYLPEVPARISRIYNYLNKELLPQCVRLPTRRVTESELNLIHEKAFTKLLLDTPANFEREGNRRINNMHVKAKDRWANDLDVSLGTQEATLVAAGSLLKVMDAVVTGECLNGYAIVRPPGHHAHHTYPAGFCFANNVAIATQYTMEKYGLKRILIVDWDVHHGDGVQELFYKDPRVLYISLHRGMEDFYPPSRKAAGYVGAEKGYGFNMNIPWSHKGMGNGDYVAAFLQLIMPVAYEFSPELVFICCGFDAALNDALGECCLTEIGYETMTKMLLALAGGRVIVALEGGYNLDMLEKCSESVMKTLMGFSSAAEPISLSPSPRAVKDIKDAIDVHISPKRSWKSLQYRAALLPPVDETATTRNETAKKAADELADALKVVKLSTDSNVTGWKIGNTTVK